MKAKDNGTRLKTVPQANTNFTPNPRPETYIPLQSSYVSPFCPHPTLTLPFLFITSPPPFHHPLWDLVSLSLSTFHFPFSSSLLSNNIPSFFSPPPLPFSFLHHGNIPRIRPNQIAPRPKLAIKPPILIRVLHAPIGTKGAPDPCARLPHRLREVAAP